MGVEALAVGQTARILNGDELVLAGTGLVLKVIDASMFSKGHNPPRPAIVVELAAQGGEPLTEGEAINGPGPGPGEASKSEAFDAKLKDLKASIDANTEATRAAKATRPRKPKGGE